MRRIIAGMLAAGTLLMLAVAPARTQQSGHAAPALANQRSDSSRQQGAQSEACAPLTDRVGTARFAPLPTLRRH